MRGERVIPLRKDRGAVCLVDMCEWRLLVLIGRDAGSLDSSFLLYERICLKWVTEFNAQKSVINTKKALDPLKDIDTYWKWVRIIII